MARGECCFLKFVLAMLGPSFVAREPMSCPFTNSGFNEFREARKLILGGISLSPLTEVLAKGKQEGIVALMGFTLRCSAERVPARCRNVLMIGPADTDRGT